MRVNLLVFRASRDLLREGKSKQIATARLCAILSVHSPRRLILTVLLASADQLQSMTRAKTLNWSKY